MPAAWAGPEALRGLEWSTPADYYTILGKQSGRWGLICGYTSKSKMARWLKEEITPLPWDWPATVAYARAALEQFFEDRALTTCVHFERDDPVRHCVTYSLSAPRRRVQGSVVPTGSELSNGASDDPVPRDGLDRKQCHSNFDCPPRHACVKPTQGAYWGWCYSAPPTPPSDTGGQRA